MLTHVNACYIKLFHIEKELTCIRLEGIIETTKAKKEKKDIAFYAFWQNWGQRITRFTHTNYEVIDYESSNKGSVYGSMVNKPRR